MKTEELKKHVPYGYGKIIAKKAGVSQRCVSLFLTGKTKSIKVEMAALEVIAELNENKKRLTEKIA